MDSIQFQLNTPIKDKDNREISILELKSFEVKRDENSVTKAIYALEKIMSDCYFRMGEQADDDTKEEIKEAIANRAGKEDVDVDVDALIEDAEKEAKNEKGQSLKFIISRYASDDETLGRVIQLMDIISTKRKKAMFFIDDRPMVDLEYDRISFRDHERLMLEYLANFILTS